MPAQQTADCRCGRECHRDRESNGLSLSHRQFSSWVTRWGRQALRISKPPCPNRQKVVPMGRGKYRWNMHPSHNQPTRKERGRPRSLPTTSWVKCVQTGGACQWWSPQGKHQNRWATRKWKCWAGAYCFRWSWLYSSNPVEWLHSKCRKTTAVNSWWGFDWWCRAGLWISPIRRARWEGNLQASDRTLRWRKNDANTAKAPSASTHLTTFDWFCSSPWVRRQASQTPINVTSPKNTKKIAGIVSKK